MAQLGDLGRARALLRSAARGFGPREGVARARCVVAEAEIALASRDLHWPGKALASAWTTLEANGDAVNAAHARNVEVRRLVLIGRLEKAERALAQLDPTLLPPALRATHELAVAGLATRRLQTAAAQDAVARATRAAAAAQIPALIAEVEVAARLLASPAARLRTQGQDQLLRLDEVETLLASGALVIDACRNAVHLSGKSISLARRPVLFTLLRLLGEAWPADQRRATLVARAFRARRADESHRARLRVEMGRLRRLLKDFAAIHATEGGFALAPHRARAVMVLDRPVEEEHPEVLALLADGESWSSSALALALGQSQRSVQRALDALAEGARVQSFGQARARRWMMPPLAGITTTLLLPAPIAD
jgi:hypothetical protein